MSALDMVYASGRLHYLGRAMAVTCGRGGVREAMGQQHKIVSRLGASQRKIR